MEEVHEVLGQNGFSGAYWYGSLLVANQRKILPWYLTHWDFGDDYSSTVKEIGATADLKHGDGNLFLEVKLQDARDLSQNLDGREVWDVCRQVTGEGVAWDKEESRPSEEDRTRGDEGACKRLNFRSDHLRAAGDSEGGDLELRCQHRTSSQERTQEENDEAKPAFSNGVFGGQQ